MKKLAVAAVLAAALGCAPKRAPSVTSESPVDQSIAYYKHRVDANPRLYPVWVQLGDAYLDKARETGDPAWIAKAHAAADRSLAMQETYAAYHLKARLAGHTHHFEESLAWAKKGELAAAMPPDYQMIALQVEALVGLGRIADAKALLPEATPVDDFFVAAGLARIANAEHRLDAAARYYIRAGELAATLKGATPHVAWAEAMAGGMLLDGGNFAAALPHLDRAKSLGGCAEEAIHRAEVLAGTGRQREGLAAYERFLVTHPDPSIHHAAYNLAKEIGDTASAAKHLAAAEAGYRKVIAANEVYTLGALAQLLLDSNGDAREALALAERNVEYKRDEEAMSTLTEAKRRNDRAAVLVH